MRHLFHPTWALCMRFDNEKPPEGGFTEDSKGSPRIRFMTLPETMKPKDLPPDFTPFPFPKYDASLGFGPVPFRNIETSWERMQQSSTSSKKLPYLLTEEENRVEAGFLQAEHLFAEESNDTKPLLTSKTPLSDIAFTDNENDVDSDLGGYKVGENFPYIDRLQCHRSVEDLLAQFTDRPQREARTATVLDLASSMHRRSNEEIERMFYELGSIFTPQGNGLQFPTTKVVKYGRPYFVSNSLTNAFIHLIEAATETFTVEQPDRLSHSPSLFIQLLHFLALVKVFQPNLWFSPSPTMPQNRADYSHPRGINRTVAYRRIGEDLFDYMANLLLIVYLHHPHNNAEGKAFLDHFSFEQLLDLLSGLTAVMPDGRPEGKVISAVLQNLFKRWEKENNEIRTLDEVRNLERLYLILNLMNVKCDAVLNVLLGSGSEGGEKEGKEKECVQNTEESVFPSFPALSLRFHPTLEHTSTDVVRGPDFFASVSREKSAELLRRAVVEFHRSLLFARKSPDNALLLALAESGMELLMTLPDKSEAVRVAREEGLDYLLLENIPALKTVKERIQLEEAERAPLVMENLHDVQSFLANVQSQYSPKYLTQFRGKFVHPIRTLLSDLFFVNSMDNVLLLHSSLVEKSVSPLISTIHQRGRSGKDLLLITTSCLRAIEVQLRYSDSEKRRNCYERALEAISYELEQGRAVFVPFTEELLLHDAKTYCDEDLMLWTLAAFFARELPLVKVLTLMSRTSLASRPYHFLKGGHSPLSSGDEDLYRKDSPLLSSLRSKELRAVTRSAVVQAPVRDRPASVFYRVNPSRQRFLYRRDKALFDKYHVSGRHIAPGFSQGALASDLRGLGFYTPDHPQVPYTPLPGVLRKHIAR